MKTKYLLIAALAGLALVGCQREQAIDSGDGDVNRYVAFEIVTPVDVKGAEVTPGAGNNDNYAATVKESEIHNIHFLFYRNGVYLAEGKTVSPGDFTFTPTADPALVGSVERKSSKVVVVLESTGAKPTEVLCLANFSNADMARIGKQNLSAALDVINDFGAGSGSHRHFYIEDGGKKYFMMSNSAYIDGGAVEAYPVMEYNIKTSAAEAISAESDALNIYLDRIAAKVNVSYNITNKALTVGTHDFAVGLKSWGLNAVNRKTYFVKELGDWKATDYPWMHIGRSGDEKFRISWAKDPNFSTSDPTTHLSDFPNKAEGYANHVGGQLYYYTMNEVLNHGFKKISGNAIVDDGTVVEYSQQDIEKRFCLENTFDNTLAVNFRRVGSHVLVLAQATMDGAVKDFYKYNGSYYAEDDYLNLALSSVSGFQTDYLFFYKDGSVYKQIDKVDLKIAKAVISGDKIVETTGNSDGYVSVFLSATGAAKTWYTVPASFVGTPTDGDVTEDTGSAKLLDAIATKAIERANAFKNGFMYYCVPIEHYNPVGTPVEMGMYGVVRNHLYNITTDDITSLGKGIYDPTEIIVPGDKAELWYLAAKVNINAWHIVKQTVNLSE